MEKGTREYDERKKILENLKYGDVITFPLGMFEHEAYLIVKEVKAGVILGQISLPTGVSGMSIEELLEKEELSMAVFKKF